jgi:hypothetical protein
MLGSEKEGCEERGRCVNELAGIRYPVHMFVRYCILRQAGRFDSLFCSHQCAAEY